MNERQIQAAFWRDRGRQQLICCSNYTPSGWFECDIFAVTKAMYWAELEIKVSVSDFLADQKKMLHVGRAGQNMSRRFARIAQETKSKHQALADGYKRGPNRFYYVMPDGLVKPEDVPDWAGLIYVTVHKNLSGEHQYLMLHQVRNGRLLHKEKVSQAVIDHCRTVFYYRYWDQLRRLDNFCQGCQLMVDEQAEDEGLWFQAKTAPEAYLQQELRKLHRCIEQTRREDDGPDGTAVADNEVVGVGGDRDPELCPGEDPSDE